MVPASAGLRKRSMHGVRTGGDGPAEGSIEEPLTVLAELQQKGLIRHIGLSTVTHAQIAEGCKICEVVCVQTVLLIPGTSSVAHLRENLVVAGLDLPGDAMKELEGIGKAGAERRSAAFFIPR